MFIRPIGWRIYRDISPNEEIQASPLYAGHRLQTQSAAALPSPKIGACEIGLQIHIRLILSGNIYKPRKQCEDKDKKIFHGM